MRSLSGRIPKLWVMARRLVM